MADEEISRIMSLVSLTGEEPLTSLAGKLREDSALSKESTLLCVGELIHRMNETLPEDKRIHDNHYYVTAREVSQQLDSMDTTHPIGRMFVGSAKNLNDAGNILIDVILQYKVESMREIPSQVTNLFVKEHAIFKSNCDELKNISPAFGVMACLADIITVKDSMRVLAAGEDYDSAEEKLHKARNELNQFMRDVDVNDIRKDLRAPLVDVLEENTAVLRHELRSLKGVEAKVVEHQIKIMRLKMNILNVLVHSNAA